MSILDLNADKVSQFAWNPLPVTPTTNAERFAIEWDNERRTGGTNFGANNLHREYERQREALRGIGINAPNPVDYDATALGGVVRNTYGRTRAMEEYRTLVEQARQQHPDRAAEFLDPEQIQAAADAGAVAARRRSEAQEQVGGGALGGLAAQAIAGISDPVNAITAPLGFSRWAMGGLARRILGTAASEAGVAAASQLAVDLNPLGAGGARERVRLGLPADIGGNALGAAIGGAVLGGGARALVEGWRLTRPGVVDGAARLRGDDAAVVADTLRRDADGNPGGPETAAQHEMALDRATEAVASGRLATDVAVPAPRRRLAAWIEQPSDPAQVDAQSLGFVQQAMEARPPGTAQRLRGFSPGFLDPAEVAALQGRGLEVSADTARVVDDGTIRKIIGRHGPGAALRDGELPVTPEAIAGWHRLAARAETSAVTRTDHGLPAITHLIREPDGSTVLVEEVRNRTGTLALKAMYRFAPGREPKSLAAVSGLDRRRAAVEGSVVDVAKDGPPTITSASAELNPFMPSAVGHFNIHTPAGRAIVAEPQVVELSSLIPSHNDAGGLNPAYPHAEGVQPRDRGRAASQAQIDGIAGGLEPARLGPSPEAANGAPIIGPDGVVESGNGRVLALRRVHADPALAAQRDAYRAWLEGQGHDLTGMAEPVLVSQRVSALTPEERRAFVREANSEGAPPPRNAVLAQAFGDQMGAWLERVLDGATEGLLARVAGAIQDVAPGWAAMRAASARGEITPGMDVTADLFAAVRTVSLARELRISVAELLLQADPDAPPLTDSARALMASMFLDPGYRTPAGRETLAARLAGYLDEAMKSQPGRAAPGAEPPTAGQVIEATDPMRGRQRAAAEAGTRQAEIAAHPDVPAAELLEAQRIAAARDVPVEGARGARELLDEADSGVAAAAEVSACLIGAVGGPA